MADVHDLLGDVIRVSTTISHDLKHVDHALILILPPGVTPKLQKCAFFQATFDYLRHFDMPGRLAVPRENTEAFEHAAFPRNITQRRSFLGAANKYRRFMTGYFSIARPLKDMLKKDADPDWVDLSSKAVQALEDLKGWWTKPPVMALTRTGRPDVVNTDACQYHLGAVLRQQEDFHPPTVCAPVGRWSKTLNQAER